MKFVWGPCFFIFVLVTVISGCEQCGRKKGAETLPASAASGERLGACIYDEETCHVSTDSVNIEKKETCELKTEKECSALKEDCEEKCRVEDEGALQKKFCFGAFAKEGDKRRTNFKFNADGRCGG